MQLTAGVIFFSVLLSTFSPSLQESIEPASLRISANEEGSFKCIFNSSNRMIPTDIFWLLNGIFVDTFPISNRQFVEKGIDENGLATITSTMTIVFDSKSAVVFNNTEVKCLGILDNDGSAILLGALTAKLYVQGILSAPSGVLVHFSNTKMYTQWTHPTKPDPADTIAYHINITYKSDYSPQDKVQTTNNSLCVLYEVCVMEETKAGVGHPGCINTSSNISILGAFNIAVPSLSVLNHTNISSSALKEESTFVCSPTEILVHTDGEFHAANVSVRNSTNSLELKLPALHNVVLESDSITLELNLSQPGVDDLKDVLFEKTESGVQAYCVYAQNSSAEGCLIILECVDYPYQECSTVLIGLARSNIFHNCNLPCATGSLYGYAYSHGVVADLPSVTQETIKFGQDITLSTSTAATPIIPNWDTADLLRFHSPTTAVHAGPLYISLIVGINCISVILLLCLIIVTAVYVIKKRFRRRPSKSMAYRNGLTNTVVDDTTEI